MTFGLGAVRNDKHNCKPAGGRSHQSVGDRAVIEWRREQRNMLPMATEAADSGRRAPAHNNVSSST